MKRFMLGCLSVLLLAGCVSGGAPFYIWRDDGSLDPSCPAAKVESIVGSIPVYGSAAVAAIGLVGTILHLGVKQAKKTAADASAKVDDHVETDHSGDGTCSTCGAAVTVTAVKPDPAGPGGGAQA